MARNKRKTSFPMQKGFTLIELLIVIFIFVMIMGITLSSFGDTKAVDEVQAASRKISSLLREAQNNSLTGREHVVSGSPAGVCDNGITLSSSGTSATITSNYIPKSGAACGGVVPEKTTTVLNVTTTTPGRISFGIPTGVPSLPGGSSTLITITSTRSSNVKASVCVYPSGAIKESFPAAASCT